MEAGIAGGTDVHHGRNIQFDHFFIQRIPVTITERWGIPVSPGRIRTKVAANKFKLIDTAIQFGDAIVQVDTGRLRQLRNTDEIFRIEFSDAIDQLVAMFCPEFTR